MMNRMMKFVTREKKVSFNLESSDLCKSRCIASVRCSNIYVVVHLTLRECGYCGELRRRLRVHPRKLSGNIEPCAHRTTTAWEARTITTRVFPSFAQTLSSTFSPKRISYDYSFDNYLRIKLWNFGMEVMVLRTEFYLI